MPCSGQQRLKFKRNGDITVRLDHHPLIENGKNGLVQFLPEDDVAGSNEFIVLCSRTPGILPTSCPALPMSSDNMARGISQLEFRSSA